MRKTYRGRNLVPGFDSLDQRIALSGVSGAAAGSSDQAETSTSDGGSTSPSTNITIGQPPAGGSSPTKP